MTGRGRPSARSGSTTRAGASRTPAPVGAADVAWGAFTETDPPWQVEPERMPWRQGIAERREATRREVAPLVRAGALPPVGRVARTGWQLGGAIAAWGVLDRGRRGSPLAARMRVAFESLGPTYVKLAQIASSASAVLPAPIVDELARCRDDVRPEPFRTVRGTIERDLGRPLREVFASFDQEPLAAASMAQVHAASLLDGTDVVVKVRRRGVSALVRDDLATMAWLVHHVVRRIALARLANPSAILEVFAETVLEELDLRLEADNMIDVARALGASPGRHVLVPRPHPELVTRRVLVMERMDGIAFDDAAGVRGAGITPEVLREAVVSFVEAVLVHGVFHGDLHGGNLFIRPDGRIALVDHGITGRFDDAGRRAFTRLLLSSAAGDLDRQLAAVRDLGAVPPDTDVARLAADLGIDVGLPDVLDLGRHEVLAHLQHLAGRLLDHGARLPKPVVLLVKDVLFLEGAVSLHAPDVDLFAEAAAVLERVMAEHGEELAADAGLDRAELRVDLRGLRQMFGLADVDALPHAELRRRLDAVREGLVPASAAGPAADARPPGAGGTTMAP